MKTIFAYVKPYKWPALIAFCLMLTELVVELIQPLIIAKIIDDGIVAKDIGTIGYWGLILLLLAFSAFTSGVINSFFSSHVAQSFAFDLRNALFSKIQSFSMATYLRFPSSGLITRLTSDVQQVQSVLFMSLRIMIRAPLSAVGSLVMAFFVNPKMAMFLLIGTPILIFFLNVSVKKGVHLFSEVQRRLDRVNRVLQENLQAIRLVKAYMRGKHESNRFKEVSSSLQDDTMKALRVMETIQPVLLFVMNISLLGALWFGSIDVRNGEAQVGELVAVVNYALRMTGSFSMFAFIINALSRAKASSERMEEILLIEKGTETYPASTRALDVKPTHNEALRFEHVTFQYPNTKKTVLQDISFTVEKGEKLAIMGATGSGKSTLLNLLPRFYDPTEGAIIINGRNIEDWPLEELREYIGYVPQSSMLFTGSIHENISWGKQEASMEEVTTAAMNAQIHHTVVNFPSGYETRVGQKGVNLSGGQKQRLSIARALIRNASILILDDSTSALDVKTETAFWDAIEGEEATMLVVTQKIRTAKGADRILLLDEGRVIGYGTHEELLGTNARYLQIVMSQQEQEGEA
ncbi:ABC transporter ATP-binding protein [Ureibacillus sinduriensis]|uniref:ABC transporter ATP-binding protein n=1 Tax=Ureibacillus sinduriensis BLB-1 = JCM 15800 TaxID=1384057 RepID=A0A0A3IMM1_9BACL|nr:ABC transporter ATP-binding protein [Ureibacillus sinduriensis]KGR76087.1 ABC transporter ATP-binding protein [Ureibacillus sinduriensis BLB-1 = JCM 15800]